MSDLVGNAQVPWLPTELDKSAESLIKEMENEFDAANIEAQLDSAELAPEPAPEATATGGTPAGEAPDTASDTKPGVNSVEVPGIERVVAREVAIAAREKAIEEKERAYGQLEARLKELEKRAMPEDLALELEQRPLETLERLGINPDQVVRRAIAARLGDKAPDELKREIHETQKDYEYRKELKALRERLEAKERESALQEFYNRVSTGAREYVKGFTSEAKTNTGYGEKAPTVAVVAKSNPDRVYDEIMQEISVDAREKAQRDPNLPLLTYDEAVLRVEKRWADVRKALVPENITAASTNPPTKPELGAEKRTPATVTTPKPTNGTVTPPDRPLAPWLQGKDALEEEGLKAALAEFRRAETPR